MIKSSRFLFVLSCVMIAVGIVALFDGYGEFASGEKGAVRWLMLPASQFILATVLLLNIRKERKSIEATNA